MHRPIVATLYMMRTGATPHMRFQDNLAEIALDAPVQDSIQLLLEKKYVSDESCGIAHHPILVPFIEKQITQIEEWLRVQSNPAKCNKQMVDDVFRTIIEWVWKDG